MAIVWIIILIVIGIGIAYFIKLSKEGKPELDKRQLEMEQIIKDTGIRDDAYWNDKDPLNARMALSINVDESSVVILTLPSLMEQISNQKSPVTQRVAFKDIIEVKVTSNSTTVTSTSRGSQLGGAVVGGVLAGGAGAVIGGLSGKTKSIESIQKLSLEIVVNDISNPIVEIPFFKMKFAELKAGTPKHNEIMEEINLWYRKFTVILHQQTQQ